MCSNYSLSICPRFLQPFSALPEGWVPKALCSQISSTSTPWGAAIYVFNFSGGQCRTLRPAPLGGYHRRLQLRWWPLSDLAASTPRGSAIDVFNIGGGRCRTMPAAPRGDPPSMSSTSVVADVGPCR
jgi:hypothetical protein